MARMSVSFFPPSLFRTAELELFHPGDTPPMFRQNNPCYERPAKTLILLHGYSGGKTDWMLNSPIQDLAARYNLAVACPAGENSFYLNQKGTGRAFGDYIGRDLPQFLRDTFGLAKNSEDTLIGGYSMGGFGALRTGLAYSHNYSKIAALSSALIIHQLKELSPEAPSPMANYAYYQQVFGDLKTAADRDCNPEVLICRKLAAGEPVPDIFLACGSEDTLVETNRAFRDFLKEKGVAAQYHESAGNHDWTFWNQYLEPAIRWMLGQDG